MQEIVGMDGGRENRILAQRESLSLRSASRHPWWLLVGFWVCCVIAIAAVVRRMVALTEPASADTTPFAYVNATFSSHAALTMAHIVPAAVFVLLAIIVLFRVSARNWVQVPFFVFGAITSITAYAMNRYAIGGWIERSAVLVFNTWFLVSLGGALRCFLRRQYRQQREWTSRAVGVLLGIATTRPVMGIFFATSPLTHLSPQQFFGIAFWIGFSVNVVVVELWLHSRSRAQLYSAVTSCYATLRASIRTKISAEALRRAAVEHAGAVAKRCS